MKHEEFSQSLSIEQAKSQQPSSAPFVKKLGAFGLSDTGIAIGLLVLCAFTRALAFPASLWEWDDINFARAIHKFDLVSQRPHPPGFPVFIMLLRVAYFFLRDDHAALLAVNYVFASLLGVVLFFLYCEIFRDRVIALGGAVLGSFAPTLWVHSGIARSDNPSMVTGLLTLFLLMRGFQSNLALLLGSVLLGVGMGIRVTIVPLTGGILALVLLTRLRRKEWKPVFGSIGLAALGFMSWYVPLIWHTGWARYRSITKEQSAYILATDPIWAGTWSIAARFKGYFVDIWGDHWIMWTFYGLGCFAILGLLWLRQWRALGLMFLAFIPFLIFTVILNTPMGVVVYSMPYVPFFTGLAACGVVLLFRFLLNEERRPVLANIGLLFVVGLAWGMADWSYPLIKLLRKEPSPPVQAERYLQKTLDKEKDILYFDMLFTPHTTYFLADYQTEMWLPDESLSLNLINPGNRNFRHSYFISPKPVAGVSNEHFQWTAGRGLRRLKPLSIGRYFDVYVGDIGQIQNCSYSAGWYQAESAGSQSWRWMGKQGTVALFNEAGEMTLHLEGKALDEATLKRKPTVVIKLDGREIEKVVGSDVNITRTIKTDATKYWSTLSIETDATIIPKQISASSDGRELGFQCFGVQWKRSTESSGRKFTEDQFMGNGWFGLEHIQPRSWRWAGEEAIVHLPAIEGDGQLAIIAKVPEQPNGKRANITVEVAGQLIETFQPPAGLFTKTFRIPTSIHKTSLCDLKLKADGYIIPAPDTRKLAINVSSITWLPAGEERNK